MAESRPLVVLGGGGHAREILDIVEAVSAVEPRHHVLGYLAGEVSPLLADRGYHHLGTDEQLATVAAEYVIAIGAGSVRARLDALATSHGLQPATLVHPDATVGPHVRLAPGVAVFAGARLTTDVEIGRHTHVNQNATVAHDCVLGDYVTVNPLAALSGAVTLADRVTVGTGAVIVEGVRVGAGTVVGAGAVVVAGLPEDVTAVGVPARPRTPGPAVPSASRKEEWMSPDLQLHGRRVLVVGGAGYVGSVLVPVLTAAGAAVTILDDLIYGHGFAITHLLEQPGVAFVKADLADHERVLAAVGESSDVVLLASLVGDPICKRYPALAARVNRDASTALYDAVAGTVGVGRFVFASTCSNYGITASAEPATETTELNPQSLYAQTKIDVEHHLLGRAADAGTTTAVLRFATAYGLSPRMRFDLTVSHFTRTLAAGAPLVVHDADTWRPYCHVRDLATAIVTVLTAPPEQVHGEVFNVGSDDQQFTKRMLIDEIARHVDDADVEYRQGDTDPRDYRVDFGKITRTLGFRAGHTVQASIPLLLQALRHGVFLRADRDPQDFGNYAIPRPEPATTEVSA